MRNLLLSFLALFTLTFSQECYAQKASENPDYTVIAYGTDSPFNDAFLVCYNKYFNLENLPIEFQNKYNLKRKPEKRKMLIEIFLGERTIGTDTLIVNRIIETQSEIFIDYRIENRDESNDDDGIFPFIILETKKSRKKFSFVENGKKRTVNDKIYVE